MCCLEPRHSIDRDALSTGSAMRRSGRRVPGPLHWTIRCGHVPRSGSTLAPADQLTKDQ